MSDSETSTQYYSEDDNDNDEYEPIEIVQHDDVEFDIPEEVLKFLDYPYDEFDKDTDVVTTNINKTNKANKQIKPLKLFGAMPNSSLQHTLFGDTPTIPYTHAPTTLYVVMEQTRDWQSGEINTVLHPYADQTCAQKYASFINKNTVCQICYNKLKHMRNCECADDRAYVTSIDLSKIN
jgi:hypothetical protein